MTATPDLYQSALRRMSSTMQISRIVCIFLVSYVHLHLYDYGALDGQAIALVRAVLVEVLGRSSVPLLSVISGFLMYGYFAKYSYEKAIGARARALVLPMIFWNGVALIFMGSRTGENPLSLANDLVALTGPSRLIYLAFLRDIFVLALLTPLAIVLVRHVAPLLLAVVGVMYFLNLSSVIILRPQIAMFYAIGLFLASRPDVVLSVTARIKGFILSLFVGVTLLQVLSIGSLELAYLVGTEWYDLGIRRPVVTLAVWILCERLARSGLSDLIMPLNLSVFPFFLSHGIIFLLAGAVVIRVPVLQGEAILLVLFVISPLFSFFLVHSGMLAWARFRAWVVVQA